MATVMMHAVVSVDGFIADEHDDVGPLFEWYFNGDLPIAGEATEVSYPAMPVTIKTPACPVVVAPPAVGAQGDWVIKAEGNSVNAQFRDGAGKLLGFALTGEAIKDKLALQKELPAILG